MKKYRVLSLVLAVLMIASVVSACDKPTDTKQTTAPADNKTTSPTPVTLTVWESDGPEKLFIEEMAKAYMVENQHVTIVAEPVSHTDTAQRL